MGLDELFIPGGPQYIPLRPINKGMILNVPSNGVPEGGVLTAKNLIVGTSGPLRRPGTSQYGGGVSVDFPPMRSIIALNKTDGTQIVLAIDRRILYAVTPADVAGIPWTYSTGLINVDAGQLTVSGLSSTNWTDAGNDLLPGDILVAGTETAGNLDMIPIGSIGSSDSLILEQSCAYDHTNTVYQIYRAFGATEPYMVNWAVVDNKIVFADSARSPFEYDPAGGLVDDYGTNGDFIPTCVEYFKDRLWFGRVLVGSTDYRSRIIWSTVTDHEDFDPTGRFLDLPYQMGFLERLVGMGDLLVAYFEDAIYIGRQTNIAGDTLPVAFDKVETGGIGLVGMNAVCKFLDGHFFVGQDDIYFLSTAGFQRIGTPVVSQTIQECDNPWAVYAAVDATRSRIIFGFPSTTDEIVKLWSYDYKAKAWSYDEIACNCIAGLTVSDQISWDQQSAYSWANTPFSSWDQARSGSVQRFFLGSGGKIYELSDTRTTDESSAQIGIELETPDWDDDLPDVKKTTTRLSLKIDRFLTTDLVLRLYWSTDRGGVWHDCGQRTIAAGDDECYWNFLATGSTVRFKITSSSSVLPYRIMEIIRRTRGRGLEVHLGPSD